MIGLRAWMLGAALCFGAAQAASDGAGEPSEGAADKAPKHDKAPPRKADKGLDDLASCKRDATALHGPERARFMTQCLHKRN